MGHCHLPLTTQPGCGGADSLLTPLPWREDQECSHTPATCLANKLGPSTVSAFPRALLGSGLQEFVGQQPLVLLDVVEHCVWVTHSSGNADLRPSDSSTTTLPAQPGIQEPPSLPGRSARNWNNEPQEPVLKQALWCNPDHAAAAGDSRWHHLSCSVRSQLTFCSGFVFLLPAP